jgi:hypothetical protein
MAAASSSNSALIASFVFSLPLFPAVQSMSLLAAHWSIILSPGFSFTTSMDTALPPFPSMMLMIPSRGQGDARECFGLDDQIIKRVLQVIESLALLQFSASLAIPLVALDSFHMGDQAGRLAASPVFRGHRLTTPHGPVDVGSAIPTNEGHVYYAFTFAPLGAWGLCAQ